MWLILITFFVFSSSGLGSVFNKEEKVTTELSRAFDDRPLLFATLGGGMVAVEPQLGNIIWKLKDEPAVKMPSQQENPMPQFLPDPRHGFLYMYGPRGDQDMLKKLPFTIPELVANAPCRSKDGILYTGKKSDTWFILDPLTGSREHISGFDKTKIFENDDDDTCVPDKKRSVYVARTEYNILMHDSNNEHNRWNVTFFDYTSHAMGKEMLKNYRIIHYTSTSDGRVVSFDRKSGELVWAHNFESPVVAVYLLSQDGLISVPFNSIGDDTLDHILETAAAFRNGQGKKSSNMELQTTLYIGEHNHGLYALSSLVDKNTITISTGHSQPLLLEGPATDSPEAAEATTKQPYTNVHYKLSDLNLQMTTPYLLLGHYKVPELTTAWVPQLPNLNLMNMQNTKDDDTIKLINGQIRSESQNDVDNDTDLKDMISVAVQTDDEEDDVFEDFPLRPDLWYKRCYVWLNQQENKALKMVVIILVGLLIAMFWYLMCQAREFQQLSQGSSRGSSASAGGGEAACAARPEELPDGHMRIGRISFHPDRMLGRGSDGTYVYRGMFDNRAVAVKRLVAGGLTVADREVALLRESDAQAHAHVVRYYCTEQDKQFKYIALELCSATLHDYVNNKIDFECRIDAVEILRQATMGLSHLHSLDIVHRDIKPHNVLLSMPSGGGGGGGGGGSAGAVRALISDFGLSKKLNVGRASFSQRSGLTGTDGWIAPEIMKMERTTTSVDIFSLGCVFYYVLSRGEHPFGDMLRRQANILNGDYDLKHLDTTLAEEDVVVTKTLVRAMLSARPASRPPCAAVLRHPVFWDKHTTLNFLQDVSDNVEVSTAQGASHPLELGARRVVRGDWRAHVCPAVADDLRARRTYRGERAAHLLRAIRNKKHHYRELSSAVCESLGKLPDGFLAYWLRRFPLLLAHAWLQMQQFRHDDTMQAYYHPTFTFSRDDVPELDNEEPLPDQVQNDNVVWHKQSGSPRKWRAEGQDDVRLRHRQSIKKKEKKKEEMPVWVLPPEH